MAAIGFQRTGYGTYSAILGNLGGSVYHQFVISIVASKNPETIRRVLVSFGDANVDKASVEARIVVIKQKLPLPDQFIDPRSVAPVELALIDQAVCLKAAFDLLRSGEAITVPPSETWTIVLTAGYSQGDANGQPTDKRARLTVLGATSTGGQKVVTY